MMPPIRREIARVHARALIHKLGIAEAAEIEVELIAAHEGAYVRFQALSGADGTIVIAGQRAVITVRNTIAYEGQKRFVIAHELGHFRLHPNTRQFEEVTIPQINNFSPKQQAEELEANLFAAELLMPESLFKPRVASMDPTFVSFRQLAQDFRTTLTSAAVQFVLNTREECPLISSSARRRGWLIASPGFSFRVAEDERIHGLSCAAEVGPMREFTSGDDIPAEAWLEGFRGNHKAVVREEARYFSRLNKILSIVWIFEEL
jgi:hypothetical protein